MTNCRDICLRTITYICHMLICHRWPISLYTTLDSITNACYPTPTCMKSQLIDEIRGKRRLCFPIKWFDRQLLFHIRDGDFRCGDSGSSLLNKNGYALGLLHAMWRTDGGVYGIASPYFAIMEALKIKICLTPYQIKPGSFIIAMLFHVILKQYRSSNF
jgi:hypothetical protein